MTLMIRSARASDAASLAELQRCVIRHTLRADYSPLIVECLADSVTDERFLRPRGPCMRLVAEKDGSIVGFGTLFLDGIVGGLYVATSHQGKGIGGSLLECIEAEARRRGLTRLRLESTLTAESFYAHRGYLAGPRVSRQLSETPVRQMTVVPMDKILGS